MPGGFTFPVSDNVQPVYQDTGQGAAGRLASWGAWVADPSPLAGPEQTRILRQDDNGALSGGPVVALGMGGCGSWGPILDGSSNGATSGGDNPFILDPGVTGTLYSDGGVLSFDGIGFPIDPAGLPIGAIWSNGGALAVVGPTSPPPSPIPIYFATISPFQLLLMGGNTLPLTQPPTGSGQLWNYGGEIWIA